MLQLTREVRFAADPDAPAPAGGQAVSNAFGGFPPLRRLGVFLKLAVTVRGPLDERSQYLLNIKDIDRAVRERAVPVFQRQVRAATDLGYAALAEAARGIAQALPGGERGVRLASLRLEVSPYVAVEMVLKEAGMVRLSSRFEFSAAHRLHNPALSPEDNVATFGKCNNPLGHGHNYELQVTLRGVPGELPTLAEMEARVNEAVVQAFDHKHLNEEVREFLPRERGGEGIIPSVENIAVAAFRRLRPLFGRQLYSVTVWETPKTWAEYSEADGETAATT